MTTPGYVTVQYIEDETEEEVWDPEIVHGKFREISTPQKTPFLEVDRVKSAGSMVYFWMVIWVEGRLLGGRWKLFNQKVGGDDSIYIYILVTIF